MGRSTACQPDAASPPGSRVAAASRRRQGLAWLICVVGVVGVAGLAGCGRPADGASYDCSVQGERFRYRAGQRQGQPGVEPLRLRLQLTGDGTGFRISDQPALAELSDPAIVRDAARSTAAESVYLLDRTDPATGLRTVSSLVLNLVSGDVRLFHHRWIPPVQWRDSDQYLYTGSCRRS